MTSINDRWVGKDGVNLAEVMLLVLDVYVNESIIYVNRARLQSDPDLHSAICYLCSECGYDLVVT